MRRFCVTGPVERESCYYVKRPEEMVRALEMAVSAVVSFTRRSADANKGLSCSMFTSVH